jgi:hypothetical protein
MKVYFILQEDKMNFSRFPAPTAKIKLVIGNLIAYTILPIFKVPRLGLRNLNAYFPSIFGSSNCLYFGSISSIFADFVTTLYFLEDFVHNKKFYLFVANHKCICIRWFYIQGTPTQAIKSF